MRNTYLFLLLAILLPGMFNACRTGQDDASWTSMNPLSIPLSVRQSCYREGNLVPNHSFKQSLSQWSVIGKDVQWTDSSASDGGHAIKITRTDQGIDEVNNQPEGVLSDFIQVIPANYDFNVDIRLEKIIPTSYLDRLQARIGKGIDLHLQFYDKDKKALDPGMYFEYVNKKVDNGFKGFAFANYFLIDTFGWARVRGETWDYPFSEGDLPDKCRYVRIFLGLKTGGTMWVDNVDFRLSKWNFTPSERMDSLFDKQYDLSELLIPTPKAIANRQHIELKGRNIGIVCQAPASPEARATVALLRKRFAGVKGDSIKIYTSEASMPESTDLDIVLLTNGRPPASTFEEPFQAIANRDQGYFIRKNGSRIYLGANLPQGWFYAAATLSQLIDYPDAILDYADITDYPDFTGRSGELMSYANDWTLKQDKTLSDSAFREAVKQRQENLDKQVRDIDFYAFYKINELYDSYGSLSKQWWLPGDFYTAFYKEIGARCAQYGEVMNTAAQVNPYFHFNMEQQEDTLSDSLRSLFSNGSEAGFEKIKGVLKPALDAGAKTVMLCSDDFVPHAGIIRGEYTLFTDTDKKQFVNLADAQRYLLRKLKAWLDKTYGHIRLEFVPPPYNNKFIDYGWGSAETYFRDLTNQLDSSIVLVWTGNTVRSLSYDLADIRRGTEVYRRVPMVWDNSPYARNVEVINGGYPMNYPQKSTLCDLFEPFDIQYPNNLPAYVDGRYYSNLGTLGEINKIKYMTYADFTWNTKDYNADFSLFKALVQQVGVKDARRLLRFNDAYNQFLVSWALLRRGIAHDSSFICTEQQKTQAEQQIKDMGSALDALKSMDNTALRQELEDVMNGKIKAWRKLVDKTKR
jgi:hypothetical protein